jgi:hypothetical protein
MIPVLTHHAQQSLNTVRGVYLLLDIFRKASYLDYCEGVIASLFRAFQSFLAVTS